MARMSKKLALTIVCKALNPFSTRDLLRRVDGKVVPIEGAEKIRIGEQLMELHDQDKKFDLKTIDNIMSTIFALAKEEGYAAALSKGDIVSGKFPTVDDFAMDVRGGAQSL